MVLERLAARLVMRFIRHDTLMDRIWSWSSDQPIWPEVNFETLTRHGYRKNELVYACINKWADTARMVSVDVINVGSEKVLDNHPVRRLLKAPNPYMNESDFWASVHIYQKLAGVAYYEKERSAGGRVVRLWPLRPDWVRPKVNKGGIVAYQYQVPGAAAVTVPPDDILAFRLFDPLSQFSHYPPAAVAMRAWATDNAVGDWFKLFLDQGGTPPGLLKIMQASNDAEISRIRNSWAQRYGGIKGWMQPVVLDVNADYQKIGSSPSEIGTEAMDARAEARICMIMDVPPIIIGAKIGLDRSTYSNAETARQSWWEDSLIPAYENHIDVIENQLLAEFGDGLKARWNYDNVPALRPVLNMKRENALLELKTGAITRNEYRGRVGLPDMGPLGDVYLLPMAVTEVPAKKRRDENTRIEMAAPPQLPAPEPEHIHRNAPDDAIRRDVEREIQDKVEDYFGELLIKIRADLTERGLEAGA